MITDCGTDWTTQIQLSLLNRRIAWVSCSMTLSFIRGFPWFIVFLVVVVYFHWLKINAGHFFRVKLTLSTLKIFHAVLSRGKQTLNGVQTVQLEREGENSHICLKFMFSPLNRYRRFRKWHFESIRYKIDATIIQKMKTLLLNEA